MPIYKQICLNRILAQVHFLSFCFPWLLVTFVRTHVHCSLRNIPEVYILFMRNDWLLTSVIVSGEALIRTVILKSATGKLSFSFHI